MKKMLKIMAMLLVIATVVFAAGCSDKKADTTAENGTQEEVTDEAPVADEVVNESEDAATVTAEDENGSDIVAEDANESEIAAEDMNITKVSVEEPANATVENITDENDTADENETA